LIERAEAAVYDLLLTCDQNIKYQQNVKRRAISRVVLGSNNWPDVRRHLAEIVAAVNRSQPGSFEFIEISTSPTAAQGTELLGAAHWTG